MEICKTLKCAIKYADVDHIKRALDQCCLLVHRSSQSKYSFLSLYMTWLTQTDVTEKPLQSAIPANELINLRGA